MNKKKQDYHLNIEETKKGLIKLQSYVDFKNECKDSFSTQNSIVTAEHVYTLASFNGQIQGRINQRNQKIPCSFFFILNFFFFTETDSLFVNLKSSNW